MHHILRWSLNSSTDVMEFSSNTWTFFLVLSVRLLLTLGWYLRLMSLFTHTILSQRYLDLSFPCSLFFTLVLLLSSTISNFITLYLCLSGPHGLLLLPSFLLWLLTFVFRCPDLCSESHARSLFWYTAQWWGSSSVDGMVIFHGLWIVGSLWMQILIYPNPRDPWFSMPPHLKKL